MLLKSADNGNKFSSVRSLNSEYHDEIICMYEAMYDEGLQYKSKYHEYMMMS